MPGLHWSLSFAPVPASRWAKDLMTPRTWSTESSSRWPSSRTAWCSALLSGRRSPCPGRASSLPVPQPLRTAVTAQRVEQHGLAHAAQPGEDDAALGSALGHPLEDDVEGGELLVAAGELGRALARRRGRRDCESGPRSEDIGDSSEFLRLADSLRVGSPASPSARLARPVGAGRPARARRRTPRRGPGAGGRSGRGPRRHESRKVPAQTLSRHRDSTTSCGLLVPRDAQRAVLTARVEEDRPGAGQPSLRGHVPL